MAADGAPVLPDVLTLDVVLGPAVQGRAHLRDGIAKPAVAKVELFLVVGPAQVEMAGLVREHTAQCRGHGVGVRGEVTDPGVPLPMPVGEYRQDPVDRAVGFPVLELAVHPFRLGREGRGEQQKPLGVVERPLDDRTPQVRIDGQPGFIAENLEGSAPVPRLGQPLKGRLQGRGQLSIRRVRVGDEPVVAHGQPVDQRLTLLNHFVLMRQDCAEVSANPAPHRQAKNQTRVPPSMVCSAGT